MTITLNGQPLVFPEETDPWDEVEWCEPCGRCTDHVNEHEGGWLAGLVRYDTEHGWRVLYTKKASMLWQRGVDVRALLADLDSMEYEAHLRSV
jgi:hypothetical protein